MKKCIIIANGKLPKKNQILFYKVKGFQTMFCADGGSNSAARLGLVPDYIVGDLDSITRENLEYYSNKCTIIKIKRQNDTDVEKCLKYAIKKGFTQAVLLGATGDRLDHSFCNLGLILKYFDRIQISILHDKSILDAYSGSVCLQSVPGETISIYGFDKRTKITSAGLKYSLKKIALPFGSRESTSNVAVSNQIKLDVRGGKIFVIRDYETLRKNGLI